MIVTIFYVFCVVSRDATIQVNTILRIALKNIVIYYCIAIFGLGPLVILKCYTCVNNSWI